MKLKKCTLDGKLALFSVFSVGLVTMDLGSDSFQADSYIEEENYKWGYSTIATMFVPFLSACVYVILDNGKALCQNQEDDQQSINRTCTMNCDKKVNNYGEGMLSPWLKQSEPKLSYRMSPGPVLPLIILG